MKPISTPVQSDHYDSIVVKRNSPKVYHIFRTIFMQVFARVHVFSTDIDECQSLATCANGICLNSEGSYTCEHCPAGYRVSYDGELCEGKSLNELLRAATCAFYTACKNVCFLYGSCLECSILGCRDEPFPSVAV